MKLATVTARGKDNRMPYEEVTGDTPDISEYVDFEFYDWVWFWDRPGDDDNPQIGRWLGVSHRVGSPMCYFILKQNGQVLSRTMVQHVTQVEQMKDDIKRWLEEFDNKVNGCLSDANHIIQHQEENAFFIEDIGELDDDDDLEFQEDSNIPEADEFTPDAYDEYIGAQILLPTADGRIQGRVVKRAKKDDGTPIGRRSNNVLHDTRRYEVELSDGTTQEYYANVIAENLFAQVDSEGQDYLLMHEISDHCKDAFAVPQDDDQRLETIG